jgi:ABC-2 type transport system ATP-binding protein
MRAPAQEPEAIEAGPGRAGGPVLEVSGLRRAYRARGKEPRIALDGVRLRIDAGQWAALLGPNGSGKSTLVRIISGADAPDSGSVAVFGTRTCPPEPRSRLALTRCAIVFQKPGLDDLLTVRENLTAQAVLYGLRGQAAERRIHAVATDMGLADRLSDRAGTLSGGLQRRVDLARALLHEPELIVLDEATAGLDHQSRSAFMDAIARLRAERPGLSLLMTTHLMDEAERADRVVMMARGRIVADGPPADLRRACGGTIVRVPIPAGDSREPARLLSEAGLEVSRPDTRTLIGRAPSDGAALAQIERAAAALARSGTPFEVAPPNLGDAYLALTGTSLEDQPPPQLTTRRRRR